MPYNQFEYHNHVMSHCILRLFPSTSTHYTLTYPAGNPAFFFLFGFSHVSCYLAAKTE